MRHMCIMAIIDDTYMPECFALVFSKIRTGADNPLSLQNHYALNKIESQHSGIDHWGAAFGKCQGADPNLARKLIIYTKKTLQIQTICL